MKTTIRVGLAIFLIGTACPRFARAEGELPMQELEVDHALTFDFPTPHTDWARPYAMGKMRVLFFSDGLGTAPRECVELMERFDIEGKAAKAGLELIVPIRAAWRTNIIEEEGAIIETRQGRIDLPVGHHAIETVKLLPDLAKRPK